jgi:hypothetical protein
MWIGIILGFIALLIIGNWIYTTVNTKNVVEYYPNGNIKLKGVTKLNNRIGAFEHFNEEGVFILRMTYENGKRKKEDFISNGGVYKTVEYKNRDKYTEYYLENCLVEHRKNRSIVLESVKRDGNQLKYVTTEFKNDREIVMEAIKSNGMALKFASSELKDNKEIVFTAIQSNINQFQYASENLKKDILFLKSIFKTINGDIAMKVHLFDYIEEINPVKINFTNKIFLNFIKLFRSLTKTNPYTTSIDYKVVLIIYALVSLIFFILPCFIWPIDSNTILGFVKQTLKKNIWIAFIVTYVISSVFLFLIKQINWWSGNYMLKKWLNSENE